MTNERILWRVNEILRNADEIDEVDVREIYMRHTLQDLKRDLATEAVARENKGAVAEPPATA